MKIDTDEDNPDHSPTTKDITAQATTIHIEATQDHSIGADATTTGEIHNNLTQSTKATATTMDLDKTHHINHIVVLHNINALQATDPETKIGHIHNHLTDL